MNTPTGVPEICPIAVFFLNLLKTDFSCFGIFTSFPSRMNSHTLSSFILSPVIAFNSARIRSLKWCPRYRIGKTYMSNSCSSSIGRRLIRLMLILINSENGMR